MGNHGGGSTRGPSPFGLPLSQNEPEWTKGMRARRGSVRLESVSVRLKFRLSRVKGVLRCRGARVGVEDTLGNQVRRVARPLERNGERYLPSREELPRD